MKYRIEIEVESDEDIRVEEVRQHVIVELSLTRNLLPPDNWRGRLRYKLVTGKRILE